MMSNKLAKRFAWSFCAVVAIAAMWQTASEALNSTPPSSLLAILTSASHTLMPLAFSALGALVITRQPHNTIGWLMLAPALSTVLDAFSTPFVSNVTVPPADPSSLFLVAVWANRISWVLSVFPFLLILLLFPTGRPPSRRWNGLVLAVVSLQMLFLLVVGFGRQLLPFSEAWSVANPIGVIPDEWVRVLYSVPLQVIESVLALLCTVSLFVRYKQGSAVEKTQIKWIAFASTIFGPLYLVTILTVVARGKGWGSEDPVALAVRLPADLTLLIIPVVIAIAILRHRLYDIDLIINRTLVYGALSAGVVGMYVLLVGALGALFGSSGNLVLALLATGLAAFLIQPLRERLQRSVNRLMYGERDDPYTVLSRLSQQLKTTLAPAAMLPKIAETIGQTLKLPYVALALNQGDRLEIAAAYGIPVGEPEQLPLVYHGEPVGQLLVARRAPGETFTPAERRLLEEIAVQAGVAAQAVRLTADLQRARERLITAREEERRRLRRDLHDGLGPQLASLTRTLAAARELRQPWTISGWCWPCASRRRTTVRPACRSPSTPRSSCRPCPRRSRWPHTASCRRR